MIEHELRRQVVTEMHLRKWPVLETPCLIVQWVRSVEESEREAEVTCLASRCKSGSGGPNESNGLPFLAGNLSDDVRFVWERHSEGSSLTLFFHGTDAAAFLEPGRAPAVPSEIAWGEQFPGKVLRATRIWICLGESDAAVVVPQIDFSATELISCHVGDGARLWSDFRIQDDGYGRLVVSANAMEPHDLTRVVQRLQELGNYRNRALLGLPIAKACWPLLNEIELGLRDISGRVSDPAATDDSLLREIAEVSIKLEAIATSANFRMSATAAYSKLVEERLIELDCRPIRGFASLIDFTQRRFLPAIRTCVALEERIEQLSRRSNQLTSLLRTRIETRIENQNAILLRSMERSSVRQLRLQELVEGLSIIALSYYVIGLLSYFLHGFSDAVAPKAAAKVVALCIPVILALTWIGVRLLKRKMIGTEP